MKQPATLARDLKRRPGESDADHDNRVRAFLNGDDVRTVTDLRDWTGSPPFHLDRYPGDTDA